MFDWWLVLGVILYIACAVLIVAEVFVPSGGIISILAAACLVGGIAIFFRYGNTAGIIGIVAAAVLIPAVIIFSYRMFPKTKFGKSVTLEPPEREPGDAIPDVEDLREFLGKTGTVLTPLRPVGMCDFSGRRIECVAEAGLIEKDKQIEVIQVNGTQLTVRAIDNS